MSHEMHTVGEREPIAYVEDDGLSVARLERFAELLRQREQARDIAALLESEVETQRRWINDARVLVEGLPCSKPPLECRRCLILRALRGVA